MSRRELLDRLAEANRRALAAAEELRTLLLAAADDGASLSEIGQALDLSRQTVRGRIRAARKPKKEPGK